MNISNLFENSNPFNTPKMPERHNAHRTFFTHEKVLERIEQLKAQNAEAKRDAFLGGMSEELLEEIVLEDSVLYDVLV